MKKLLLGTVLALSAFALQARPQCIICPEHWDQGQYRYARIWNFGSLTQNCVLWSSYYRYNFIVYPGTPSPTVPIAPNGITWSYDCRSMV